MATINISDLRPTGSELFSDSEGYMNELGEGEIGAIQGGSLVNISIRVSIVSVSVLVTLFLGEREAN